MFNICSQQLQRFADIHQLGTASIYPSLLFPTLSTRHGLCLFWYAVATTRSGDNLHGSASQFGQRIRQTRRIPHDVKVPTGILILQEQRLWNINIRSLVRFKPSYSRSAKRHPNLALFILQ